MIQPLAIYVEILLAQGVHLKMMVESKALLVLVVSPLKLVIQFFYRHF
jgi:hypothetical protein